MSEASVSPSNQLVSWPVAVQCARDRMRSGPVITFTILLGLTGIAARSMRSPADIFGGVSPFSRLFLLALTLALGSALISEEVDSGHAQLVLLRPLSRAAFFGGRLAGAGMVLLAAMTLSWLVAVGFILVADRFTPYVFLALPIAFLWAFAWLALLAAVSAVVRGSGNAVWVMVCAVLWVTIKFGTLGIGTFAEAQHRWPWMVSLKDFANVVLPFIGPQDANDLVEQVVQHATLDFNALLLDLVYIAGSWTAGAYFFSKRELARRRG